MKNFENILTSLATRDDHLDFILGHVDVPIMVVDSKSIPHGFPPALIPLYRVLDSNDYVGYWRHYFGIKRKPTIVQISAEMGYKVWEIAISIEQLIASIIQKQIFIAGDIDDKIIGFARSTGFKSINEIRQVVEGFADDEIGLMNLELFKNPPLSICEEPHQYKGDFPSSDSFDLDTTCMIEISDETIKTIQSEENCPLWFSNRNKIEVFEMLLNSGDHNKAWLWLNSHGWLFGDAKTALAKLLNVSDDAYFNDCARAWLSCPHRESEQY